MTVNGGAAVSSSGGNVTLAAGDNLTLQPGSTVSAASGLVTLQADVPSADAGTGANLSLLGRLVSSSQAQVLGGPDGDTITVNPDATNPGSNATTLLLDGAGSNDTYFVQVGNLSGQVNIQDSGATTGDQATVQGTAANEDFLVHNHVANGSPQTGGSVVRTTAPTQTVDYTQTLERLTVRGEDGNDTFHVQPSQTALITIHGGDPTFGDAGVPPAGDTLDFESLNNTFNVSCGVIATQGGNPAAFQNVLFQNIENLPLNPTGGTTQLFDLDPDDPAAAVTQPGYTSVRPTTVYGAEWLDLRLGYGAGQQRLVQPGRVRPRAGQQRRLQRPAARRACVGPAAPVHGRCGQRLVPGVGAHGRRLVPAERDADHARGHGRGAGGQRQHAGRPVRDPELRDAGHGRDAGPGVQRPERGPQLDGQCDRDPAGQDPGHRFALAQFAAGRRDLGGHVHDLRRHAGGAAGRRPGDGRADAGDGGLAGHGAEHRGDPGAGDHGGPGELPGAPAVGRGRLDGGHGQGAGRPHGLRVDRLRAGADAAVRLPGRGFADADAGRG